MAVVLEQFIRNSDNLIKLELTEDGVAITGAWTGLNIYFGGVALNRTADGDGVTLSTTTGILVISPGDLTTAEKTAVDALETKIYKVQIVVTSTLNDDGAVFGGSGSTSIRFQISDKPA